MLTNAILTHGSIQAGPLAAALAWLAGVGVAAALLFRRNMRRPGAQAPAGQGQEVRLTFSDDEEPAD
jgi:hypothetical protein